MRAVATADARSAPREDLMWRDAFLGARLRYQLDVRLLDVAWTDDDWIELVGAH